MVNHVWASHRYSYHIYLHSTFLSVLGTSCYLTYQPYFKMWYAFCIYCGPNVIEMCWYVHHQKPSAIIFHHILLTVCLCVVCVLVFGLAFFHWIFSFRTQKTTPSTVNHIQLFISCLFVFVVCAFEIHFFVRFCLKFESMIITRAHWSFVRSLSQHELIFVIWFVRRVRKWQKNTDPSRSKTPKRERHKSTK